MRARVSRAAGLLSWEKGPDPASWPSHPGSALGSREGMAEGGVRDSLPALPWFWSCRGAVEMPQRPQT